MLFFGGGCKANEKIFRKVVNILKNIFRIHDSVTKIGHILLLISRVKISLLKIRIKWSLRKCPSHLIRACNDVTTSMPRGLFSRLDPSLPA